MSAVPLKYFYDLMSPPGRALRMFLLMNKIPYVDQPIALRKREHLTEDYAKNVSVFKKNPVIHHGEFRLTETPAILRYLVETFRVEDFWYPKDPKKQARVDEYLSWTHNNIRMAVGMSFFHKFRDPILFGTTPDPKIYKKLDKDLQKVLDDMENLWMDNAFIAGNKFSFADALAAADVEQAKMTGINPLENRPKLSAWMNRTKKQMEPLFTDHHKFVYKIEEVMKNKNLN